MGGKYHKPANVLWRQRRLINERICRVVSLKVHDSKASKDKQASKTKINPT
jgi:hypothetical protein